MSFSELAREFALGLGVALFGANLWVLLRPVVARRRHGRPVPRPTSTRKVVRNMIIGGVIAGWALIAWLRT
jgi:hypothetical protein